MKETSTTRFYKNFQLIENLLPIPLEKIYDPQYFLLYEKFVNRIHCLELIQTMLYSEKDHGKVDIGKVIDELIADLREFYHIENERIDFFTNYNNITMNIEIAIPCVTIIVELINNSLKHAFPSGKKGIITLALTYDHEAGYHLVVKDNGIGFMNNDVLSNQTNLGMSLIKELINELNGNFTIFGTCGVTATIQFNDIDFPHQTDSSLK